MRKKINILLGALMALFCGCKTQQTPSTPADRPMVMYGPPSYFQIPEPTPQDDGASNELNTENSPANTPIAQ